MHNLDHVERIIAKALGQSTSCTDEDAIEVAFSKAGIKAQSTLAQYGDSLASAVERFAAATLDASSISFFEPRHNAMTGLSGLPLYFVESEHKTKATIKAIPSPALFAQMVWAHRNLYRLGCLVPSIIAVGGASQGEHHFFLVATTFIDGSLVNDHLLALATMAPGAPRQDKLQGLCMIIEKIGAALGHMHTLSAPTLLAPAAVVTYSHQQAFRNSLICLERFPEFKQSAQTIADIARALIATHAQHNYRYAYIHGDAHPGNFLFNEVQQEIATLDLDRAAPFIGSRFEPLGSPFTDYVKMTASMKVRELFGITPTESAIMRTAFDHGYESAGGRIPSKELEDYYTLMEVFDYLSWYLQHAEHLAPEVQGIMRAIGQTGVGWLKEIFGA